MMFLTASTGGWFTVPTLPPNFVSIGAGVPKKSTREKSIDRQTNIGSILGKFCFPQNLLSTIFQNSWKDIVKITKSWWIKRG